MTDTITPMQIRGARAQIGWTQEDLASRAGVSVNSIKNIEAETTNPRPAMMHKIRSVFENAGFEFLPHNGFQMRDDKIVVYENLDGVTAFFDDVYEAVKEREAEPLINGVDEFNFVHNVHGWNRDPHEQRMNILCKNRNKVFIKCILKEKDQNEHGVPYAEYRTVPADIFPTVTTYVYEDKVGIFLWNEPTKILVVTDADMAEAYRIQFYLHWEKGTPV